MTNGTHNTASSQTLSELVGKLQTLLNDASVTEKHSPEEIMKLKEQLAQLTRKGT
jgi:cytoplasmic iron level regulating protein YaaA (DUF328/UPF0246 family)